MQARLEREAYDGPTSPDVRHEKGAARRPRAAGHRIAHRRRRRRSRADVHDDRGREHGAARPRPRRRRRGAHLQPRAQRRDGAVVLSRACATASTSSIVRLPSRTRPAATMVDAFEAAMTPRDEALLLSHVSWNRGTRLPMREICAMAHARGALVAVDAAQSAGQIDFNVREMDCDLLALPGHKWLLGPDGAAALYVRRDLIERLQPLAVVHGANRHYDFEGNFELRERHDPQVRADDAQRSGARRARGVAGDARGDRHAGDRGALPRAGDALRRRAAAASTACASRRRSMPRCAAAS